MGRRKRYIAVLERDPASDAWLAHIKDIENCHTYGRTIRQARGRIREALSAWLDRDPEELEIEFQLPATLVRIGDDIARARSEVSEANTRAQSAAVKAARQLTRMGLSTRDAAEVLGISHQRVHQLLGS